MQARFEFDPARFEGDLDAYFQAAEAKVPNLREGVHRRVHWAGKPGAKTPLSVVYLHGFSASSEEIRPVTDRVAEALGANLIYNRVEGHGRDGAAMLESTEQAWHDSAAEAIQAGYAAGDQVVVISTSTGGTIAALAALDPALAKGLKGIVFVSPNFEVAGAGGRLLTWPGAQWWLPLLAGRERGFEPLNDAQAQAWTHRYPMAAVLPMARLVKHCRAQDFRRATAPALFFFSDGDQVVNPEATRGIAARWGGPVTLAPQVLPPGNDASQHVIAGDIVSPGMTDRAVAGILEWVRGL